MSSAAAASGPDAATLSARVVELINCSRSKLAELVLYYEFGISEVIARTLILQSQEASLERTVKRRPQDKLDRSKTASITKNAHIGEGVESLLVRSDVCDYDKPPGPSNARPLLPKKRRTAARNEQHAAEDRNEPVHIETKEDGEDDMNDDTELKLEREARNTDSDPSALSVLPSLPGKNEASANSTKRKRKSERALKKNRTFDAGIDWARQSRRHIALRISYEGYPYSGFSFRDDGDESVESYLFNALVTTKLVPHRDDCAYARCGRTDKGVSALGQVVSLYVRSRLKQDVLKSRVGYVPLPGNNNEEDHADDEKNQRQPYEGDESDEVDYIKALNRVLPVTIRVLKWSPVPLDFSARFSCEYRVYKYFFYDDGMNLSRMQEAANFLTGPHDFRNFCKMDVVGLSHFERNIRAVKVQYCHHSNVPAASTHQATTASHSSSPSSSSSSTFSSSSSSSSAPSSASSPLTSHVPLPPVVPIPGYVPAADRLCEITVVGEAFLYHQIRCIVALLFLVGLGRESPKTIETLLDIQQCPRKPNYRMASDVPLVLWDCAFPSLVKWRISKDAAEHLLQALHCHWREKHIFACLSEVYWKMSVAAFRGQAHSQAANGTVLPLSSSSSSGAFVPSSLPLMTQETDAPDSCATTTLTFPFGPTNTAVYTLNYAHITDSFQAVNAEDESYLGPLRGEQLEPLNTITKGKYVPLLKRQKDFAYEDKVKNLKGKKLQRKIMNNEFLQVVNAELNGRNEDDFA